MSAFISENILTIIALMIGVLGGLPGIIAIITYFKTSKLNVVFDRDNSIACFLKGRNLKLNNKLALILLRLTITGKGLIPSYIKTIELFIKVDFKWKKGVNFHPTEYFVTDKNDVKKKSLVLVKQINTEDRSVLFIASWEKFIAGDVKLEYGQPLKTSKAAAFDVKYNEYEKCKKVKIVVSDFLNKKYSLTIKADFAFNSFNSNYFLYDNIIDTGIKNVDKLQ